MHDQFADREEIEDLHKRRKLFRIMVTESSFDRDLHAIFFCVRIDVRKEPQKRIFILQKPRAFSFRADGAGGASEIQIYLAIAKPYKCFCSINKMLGAAGQDLRDQVDPCIVFGRDIFSLARRERTLFGRRNERREVLVHVAVDLGKSIAENVSCDAFERREINLHVNRGSSHMHQFKSIQFKSVQVNSIRFRSTESIVSRGVAFLGSMIWSILCLNGVPRRIRSVRIDMITKDERFWYGAGKRICAFDRDAWRGGWAGPSFRGVPSGLPAAMQVLPQPRYLAHRGRGRVHRRRDGQ